MNEVLLSQLLVTGRWIFDSIEAEAKGKKTEDEIMTEHEEMQESLAQTIAAYKARRST